MTKPVSNLGRGTKWCVCGYNPNEKKNHFDNDANTDGGSGAMTPSENNHKNDIHLDHVTNDEQGSCFTCYRSWGDDQKREERLDNFHYLPGSW